MKKLLFLLVGVCMYASLFGQRDITLKGKTYRAVDSMVLYKGIEDWRYQGVTIQVQPDSTFEYVMKDVEHIEEYKLTFWGEVKSGGWFPISFYSDSDEIVFEIYSMQERMKNKVSGSPLSNFDLKPLYEKLTTLYYEPNQKYFSQAWYPKRDTIDPKIYDAVDSVKREIFTYKQNYFAENPTLVGYYHFFSSLEDNDEAYLDHNEVVKAQEFWSSKFPDHPVNEYVANLIRASYQIKEGGSYINIPLLEANGNRHDLSEEVKSNKYTLLDLWAPWCGPCIRKSKKIKENYDLVQEKGIKVVAVMGGIATKEKYFKTKKKYDYPWEVYIERSNENNIWQKYGIPYAGGTQVLIDNTGKIVAVNPKLEVIKNLPTK